MQEHRSIASSLIEISPRFFMTLPDLIRKTKPAIVSVLAVLLCLLTQKWIQVNLRNGSHLVLKHPFFPYFPIVLYMGYLYGMRIGTLTIATSAILLLVMFPGAIEDWRIGIPLHAILFFLSLRLIERCPNTGPGNDQNGTIKII
ncbi:MAG: hypothetical protein ACK443_11295 [Methylococcaceae bacterium]